MRNTILRHTIIGLLLCLPALLGIAQVKAVNYTNSYYEPSLLPFHSTSVYTDQWKQGDKPIIDTDGFVNYEAYGISKPNRAKRVTPNPDVDENDPGNVPLGDAVLPLLLLAFAYICARRVRLINKEKRQ